MSKEFEILFGTENCAKYFGGIFSIALILHIWDFLKMTLSKNVKKKSKPKFPFIGWSLLFYVLFLLSSSLLTESITDQLGWHHGAIPIPGRFWSMTIFGHRALAATHSFQASPYLAMTRYHNFWDNKLRSANMFVLNAGMLWSSKIGHNSPALAYSYSLDHLSRQ